jgi:hypothetical protein
MSDRCDSEQCFCCGTGHWCEPDRYPEALGDAWTCPECRREHLAFDPHAEGHLSDLVLSRIPANALGWRSTDPLALPDEEHQP